ncbi:MAG: urease accessory protein [Halothiobacillaceae bacterium]|nr:MAG: urease accessory protein [Halothiobacillaceae bacterium]
MLQIHQRITTDNNVIALTLSLPYELRQKSRLYARLDNGMEVGLFLPRGTVLRGGDILRSDDGQLIRVCASTEALSIATTDDHHLLARACYHLGNRHVPLQIGHCSVCYRHDHVLDEMVVALGLSVQLTQAPFEPEPGAYSTQGEHHHEHSA